MADQDRSESETLLHIYLNDHRATAAASLALAERSLKNNRGTAFERGLQDLHRDLRTDAGSLDDALGAVGAGKSIIKVGLAWAGERVGRLKLNGTVREYSPLSRVHEVEALANAVRAKRLMWATLAQLQRRDERLASFDFPALQERADDQSRRLERLHDDAVAVALGDRQESDVVEMPGGAEPSPTRPPGDSPWVGDDDRGDEPRPVGGAGVTPTGTSPGNADTSVFEAGTPSPGTATEADLQSADEDTFPPSG